MSAKIIGDKYSFDFTDLIGKGLLLLIYYFTIKIKGNYGIVFKGKNLITNTPVAIKLLIFDGNTNDKQTL